jgi:hypothetical protein
MLKEPATGCISCFNPFSLFDLANRPADQQQRWIEMHQRFFDGLVTQVKGQQSNHVFSRNV